MSIHDYAALNLRECPVGEDSPEDSPIESLDQYVHGLLSSIADSSSLPKLFDPELKSLLQARSFRSDGNTSERCGVEKAFLSILLTVALSLQHSVGAIATDNEYEANSRG